MAVAPTLAGKVQAAVPKMGGHYKQALTGGATSDVLDPAQTLDSYMINVSFGPLRNNLNALSPSGELTGEWAAGWGASADGLVVVGGTTSDTLSIREAFRWTARGGMVGRGDLPAGLEYSPASGTSADGSVVVGTSGPAEGAVAFSWTS